ncbi:MAG: S8 family serine peptidase [Methanomassiliicoccales archaeon]|nr:MAG: S8 family serine peptidase [Methanomassiliicoccales archaeon]
MEKRNLILLSILVVAICVLVILFWMAQTETDNGVIPWIDDNDEPDIERTEWAFEITQVDDINEDGYDGDGVVIGIVDSGIDITHPDLDHINISAWMDYVNGRPEPYDDNGHGTHIAGIIAANGEIEGIAPKVKMVVVKAISASGSGSGSDVASGIDFCVENGADVICLSLGGRARFLNLGDETATACEDAIDQGVFVVAAAGNDGEDPNDNDVASPATVDEVIAVGAIDENKHIASFSSKGDNDGILPIAIDDRRDPDKKPELVAPGVEIVSTWTNGEYVIASGTSQATAFVAGGIVLLLDAHPESQREGGGGGSSSTITHFKEVFMDTAEKCPGQDTPHDDHYGYGLINVENAEGAL